MVSRSLIVRELLWLLGILLAALLLTSWLVAWVKQVPGLYQDLRSLFEPDYDMWVFFYVLVVLACYLGRLGAYGATRLAQSIAPEAGL